MKGCSQVYHVAGIVSYMRKDFDKMMKVHVQGTKNILSVAKELKVKKAVYTSSTAAIGLPASPEEAQDETAFWDNKFNSVGYMYSKMLAEKEVLKACNKDLNAVIVNPTSFFGQGDINMNEGELVKNIKAGKLGFALPGGNSVVSVDDTVEGHLLAMKKGKKGERYILANEFFPFIELFNVIASELKVKKINKVLPKKSFYLLYPASKLLDFFSSIFGFPNKLTPQVVNFSFHFRYYNSDKARKELGWKPKQSFKQAIPERLP
jgi:dihydroflavonol-4-reductase